MNRAWSPSAIQTATGIPARQITRALRDRGRISPRLIQQIAVAYESLWDKEPPRRTPAERQAADAARELARARNWPPPAGWDDDQIDLPDGRPAPGWKRTTTLHRSADVAEDVAFLRETGYAQATPALLALRLDMRTKTLEKALSRAQAATTSDATRKDAELELEAG